MSATDLANAIGSKEASSQEVIEAHLRRVEEKRLGIITPIDPW